MNVHVNVATFVHTVFYVCQAISNGNETKWKMKHP